MKQVGAAPGTIHWKGARDFNAWTATEAKELLGHLGCWAAGHKAPVQTMHLLCFGSPPCPRAVVGGRTGTRDGQDVSAVSRCSTMAAALQLPASSSQSPPPSQQEGTMVFKVCDAQERPPRDKDHCVAIDKGIAHESPGKMGISRTALQISNRNLGRNVKLGGVVLAVWPLSTSSTSRAWSRAKGDLASTWVRCRATGVHGGMEPTECMDLRMDFALINADRRWPSQIDPSSLGC